jgi:hypothetical protein
MYYGAMTGGGSNQLSSNNPTATQEVQMETGGYTAEDWNNGGHVNIIPKSGGNTFHGSFQADFGNKALQSGNITPELQALGVPSPSSIRSLYEVAGGVGGPIKKDKLWFFVDARHWISSSYQAGANFFYDANEAVLRRGSQPPGLRHQHLYRRGPAPDLAGYKTESVHREFHSREKLQLFLHDQFGLARARSCDGPLVRARLARSGHLDLPCHR